MRIWQNDPDWQEAQRIRVKARLPVMGPGDECGYVILEGLNGDRNILEQGNVNIRRPDGSWFASRELAERWREHYAAADGISLFRLDRNLRGHPFQTTPVPETDPWPIDEHTTIVDAYFSGRSTSNKDLIYNPCISFWENLITAEQMHAHAWRHARRARLRGEGLPEEDALQAAGVPTFTYKDRATVLNWLRRKTEPYGGRTPDTFTAYTEELRAMSQFVYLLQDSRGERT